MLKYFSNYKYPYVLLYASTAKMKGRGKGGSWTHSPSREKPYHISLCPLQVQIYILCPVWAYCSCGLSVHWCQEEASFRDFLVVPNFTF